MKKTLLLFATIFFISGSLLAQKKNEIKTDLFSPIFRTGTLKYERVLTDNFSVQVGFLYSGYQNRNDSARIVGFAVTPEFRFYLSDTPAPNGTYLAAHARYINANYFVSELGEDPAGTWSNISLGINLGKQVLLKNIIIVDAWVGPTYNIRSLEVDGEEIDFFIPFLTKNGFGIRMGLAIGIAF